MERDMDEILIETDRPSGMLSLRQTAKALNLSEDYVRGLSSLTPYVSKTTGERYYSTLSVREFREGMDRRRG
jgi:hypothetical protein